MNKIKPENYFYLNNGEILRSAEELKIELEKNCEGFNLQNFYHHNNLERNDYAEWIKYVLHEKKLAEKIKQLKTPQDMLNEIKKYNFDLKKEKTKEENHVAEQKNILTENEQKTAETTKEDNQKEITTEEPKNMKEIEEDLKNLEELSERSEKMLEKTNGMKKKSYLQIKENSEVISELKNMYEEIYTRIADYRKEGKDMFIPYMHLRLIKQKIHFLEISKDEKEQNKIKILLEEVNEEIREALKNEQQTLKEFIIKKANIIKEKKEE